MRLEHGCSGSEEQKSGQGLESGVSLEKKISTL